LSHYSLINRATGQIIPVPLMEFHFVQLPKFNKSIEECTTDFDKWLYFMKKADACEQVPAQMKKSKDFTQAFEILNKRNWTNEEFKDYVDELDSLGREDRVAEGNFHYGKEEGKVEGQLEKAQAIAMELLKLNIALDVIMQSTGLSIEKIEDLEKKYNKK
jgi:predicted transposase/invertase (TIGR01784 family)